jgi:DNA-binding IclR family transcriptional regulator
MKVKGNGRADVASSAWRLLDIEEYIILKDVPEVSIGEIAEKFDISKSSSYRMLNTLFRKGYLDHGKGETSYHPGFKIIEIGWAAISKNKLAKVSSQYLEKLVNLTGESAILGILHGNEVFNIEKLSGRGILRVDVEVETRAPIHCTSLGKALLAWLPEHEILQVVKNVEFRRYTPITISSKELFLEDLKITRERGYAITGEEYVSGTCSIAVPVRNGANRVIAALSLVVPKARFSDEKIKDFTKHLFLVAKQIESKLSMVNGEIGNGGAL